MKSYQDLLKAGDSPSKKGKFCVTAIETFKGTPEYKSAQDGEAYYNKHNLTIEKYQKFLYTISGRQVPDLFSANYKLKTLFFRRLVIQQIQYVLGNGIKFENDETMEKLGADFEFMVQEACKLSMTAGRAFGFWNMDHLEVFGFADTPEHPGFCPLYDEETAVLMGGIRFWTKKVGDVTTLHFTLYEPDGYTEYIKQNSDDIKVLEEKRAYIQTVQTTQADGVCGVIGRNYESLPIVPLYSNDTHESELIGIRECIDCYDYIKSGLANDIDDTSGFFWVVKNAGGMDDTDLAQFVQRMKTVRAATLDDESDISAHTLAVPTEARTAMLELLRSDIYEDFQALDVKSLSAAQKTTQEIQAAYQAQDNKCADFERYVLHFIRHIMRFAEVDDNPVLRRNRIVNQSEQTAMVLSAASYLSDECIIRHLPFLTPEEAAAEIDKLNAENYNRFAEE